MTAPSDPDRAFVDANILIAAALGGACARLWSIPQLAIVTSDFAVQEAVWNLEKRRAIAPGCLDVLAQLLSGAEIVSHEDISPPLYSHWDLPDPDDVPILYGAVESNCRFLVTADTACFGALMGKRVDGVEIIKPGKLLARYGQ